MDAGTQAAIQVAVGQTLAQAKLPGATVAIHTAGQPALALGIGHQDRRQARPLPREARFYLYSITKCLSAAAVMGHARAADLSLDAPIQDYWQSHWPEFPVQTPVTLRQILSHTSGLPDYGGLPAYHEAVKTRPQQPWSAEQFLAVARSRGLLFEPGTGWSYSNLGYLALKLLLEQSLGQP
ncbi:MAG TPA: serine hydrolase domain-containing protein, partial [Nodosilinea sp.]|nr:serine hydrolase domain-containing protein [Nodosilinea sp.]